MRLLASILAICLLSGAASAQPHEVWAPGVSRAGGWVDYNKAPVNDGVWADTAMCWAASSSNVIKWWMNQNAELVSSMKTPPPEDPWTVFRAVYGNVGSTPSYGLGWYIDGVTNSWGDTVPPSGYDEAGWSAVEDKSNGEWPYGTFLTGAYSTAEHAIQVAQNPGNTDGRALTLGILNAVEKGYALSLSAYNDAGNAGVAHAVTLWGVEYTGEGDERIITRMWITDSDDGVTQLVEYAMVGDKESSVAFGSGGNLTSATIGYAAGMWSDPELVPEPATATLGLLALAGLAARRRRK